MSQDILAPTSYPEAVLNGFSTEQARKVAACTAGFVTLGGLSGSAVAAYKYAPAIPAAFNSAISTAGPAFIFFSLREYIAVPTFAYAHATGSMPHVKSLRLRNLAETGSAGFSTGAILSLYHCKPRPVAHAAQEATEAVIIVRSPARALSGGFTFALFACGAQLAVNQANALRVNYIKRQVKPTQAWSEELGDVDLARQDTPEEKAPITQRVTEAILSVTPIRKVSNDEYAETLKQRIQQGEQQLNVVTRQMEDIQQRLQQAHQEKDSSL